MSGQSERRNRAIDILKGLCAIFVIVNHFNLAQEDRLRFLFPYWIDMAVPVFMIVSGYVYSISYEHRGIDSWRKAYQCSYIIDKLLRYTIPFLIAISMELVMNIHYFGLGKAVQEWVAALFTGGAGMGAYYFPIMIQFVFLFPAIYFLIKRYDFAGLAACGLLNALFEWMQRLYGFSDVSYRLLIFRYMLLIAFGCYICVSRSLPRRWVSWGSLFLGIAYIWLCCYRDYEPKVIIYWTRTSFVAALYIMPVIGVILVSKCCRRMKCRLLEVLGKASYHIFLTQMVYYNYLAADIYSLEQFPRIILLLITIGICVAAGVAFYYIESRITARLQRKSWDCGKTFGRAAAAVNDRLTRDRYREDKEGQI